MSPVKQIRLATLLAVVLVAGTAQAQTAQVSGSTRLQPAPGSDETNASGAAKFQGSVSLYTSQAGTWIYEAWFDGTLTVSCRGLTPFATYVINESEYFTADSKGGATLTLSPFMAFGFGWGHDYRHLYASVEVVVARQVTADSYVEVLEGAIDVRVW